MKSQPIVELTASIQARRASEGSEESLACASGLYFHQPTPRPGIGVKVLHRHKLPHNYSLAISLVCASCYFSAEILATTRSRNSSSISDPVRIFSSTSRLHTSNCPIRGVSILARSLPVQIIASQLGSHSLACFSSDWMSCDE